MRKYVFCLGVALATCGMAVFAQSSGDTKRPNVVDCSLDGVQHSCNREEFLHAFAEAHSVALDSQPRSRMAEGQMAEMVRNLSKEVVAAKQPADLTFHLVRDASDGVSVGSGDVELATLRVFSSKGPDSHLLWVERYRGQPDLTWPDVVRALLRQFQATVAGR